MTTGKTYGIAFDQLKKVINSYQEKGGIAVQIDEGVLGMGTWVLYGKGMFCFVSYEHVLNEWSTQQVIRRYKKLPKKWQKMADDHLASIFG